MNRVSLLVLLCFISIHPLSLLGNGETERLFDNLSFGLAYDFTKQPQDLGINAGLGGRAHLNWGIPVIRKFQLGLQIGGAVAHTANAVVVQESLSGTSDQTRSFITAGVFQHTGFGLKWAFVHDYLIESYFNDFDFNQFRGLIAYELTPQVEMGTWFTIPVRGDTGKLSGRGLKLDPMYQGILYGKYTFSNNTQLSLWLGIAQRHGRSVFILNDNLVSSPVLVYGSELFVPLGNYVAAYGMMNYVLPTNSGSADISFGLVFHLDGKVKDYPNKKFAPLLPVGSSSSFVVDSRFN